MVGPCDQQGSSKDIALRIVNGQLKWGKNILYSQNILMQEGKIETATKLPKEFM